MSKLKSIQTTITGSISSIIPMFFTVCKTGACATACASPIAALFGVSSASLIASPITQSLFPLLLAISAVSFTISYYNIYVLPKKASTCNTDCACDPPKKTFQQKFSIYTFWIGLVASITFFSYFEYQNYEANSKAKEMTINQKINNTAQILPSNSSIVSDTLETEKPCCSGGQECSK
jgi:hypothetical protein